MPPELKQLEASLDQKAPPLQATASNPHRPGPTPHVRSPRRHRRDPLGLKSDCDLGPHPTRTVHWVADGIQVLHMKRIRDNPFLTLEEG